MGVFKLFAGEKITACVSQVAVEQAACETCGDSYRTIVVVANGGHHRAAALCAEHFFEAAKAFPEIQQLEGPHFRFLEKTKL